LSDAPFEYLTREDVIRLHHAAIGRWGGSYGLRDSTALESCLAQPKTLVFDVERFRELHEKAAAYAFYLATLHPFVDGNKRTGGLAALQFGIVNGVFPDFAPGEIEAFMKGVAKGEFDLEQLVNAFERPFRC
jgi:death-on-curing protein